MGDIFYHGVWRMDWGLGNPNITAALIATLMMGVWFLAFIWKKGFWVALGLFTVLGGCLIHTFSRGGLVAFFVGLIPLIVMVPRPWPRRRLVAAGLAFWVMIGFAFYLNADDRYRQGVVKQDRSITNRLILWKHAPLMIVDAPGGWGWGNAAKAYMKWYQPLGDDESYRTFVNSHLEWLIEFGWPMRFFYLFAWGAVFVICWPSQRIRWLGIPLGIWVAFAVAATFSSVAESPWLWILPCLVLLAVLSRRWLQGEWPRLRTWAYPLGFALTACIALLLAGGNGTSVHGSQKMVTIGAGKPAWWLVVDERAVGGERFAKSLRKYLIEHPVDQALGIVWSVSELPKDVSGALVTVAGFPSDLSRSTLQKPAASAAKLILLCPGYHPQEAGVDTNFKTPVNVIFGEFSQSAVLVAWQETGMVHRIEGVGDYFPAWPQIILGRYP